MTQELKDKYIQRINEASPLQLTIINYELLLANILDGRKAAPRSAECTAALDKARECLATLFTTLDMNIEFSKDLANLYLYVNKCIIHAGMRRTDDEKNVMLDDAAKILSELKTAWQTLAADENLLAKMAEGEQTYAGLTYGKDGKLEEYQDFDPNKGYKA